MIFISKRSLRATVTVATSLILFGLAAPAQAEGSFSSTIKNWLVGSGESRRWTDKNTDATSTSMALSGCSSTPTSFKSADFSVYRDVFGPDWNQGTKRNYCGTSYWGDLAAGEYYLRLELVNGNGSGFRLSAKGVTVRY
ncbi:hypothetical protein I3F58_10020 [Streptomyces sp. MUM 203J]|uniref:hypothetical protein n=1 Tax=Streptomyces sp. MUM 203J TaxID=2791990 RepID=UPI001F04BFF4|nr:hypothetical protein [Streptomyces sp. MUM 203J]MCH0539891.1 hypothetical protein [Streptomyces sp. MUM 203J]